MSKKELLETRLKGFRFIAIISVILLHASIVVNDLFLKTLLSIVLAVSIIFEMYIYDKLLTAIKRKR